MVYAQTPQINNEAPASKSKEIEVKLTTLDYTDLQNTMTELNLIRTKLDEHSELMSKNCQQLTEKNKTSDCFANTKGDLKKLWGQYFAAKEKYLNFLYQHFQQENTKQAKITLDFIDSLQSAKPKR